MAALALALAAGCADGDADAVGRMLDARGESTAAERDRIARRVREVAGASRVSAGRPVGYPDDFPLVDGYTVVSGSVDPGVVSTATLAYGRPAADVADTLVEAAGRVEWTLELHETGPSGIVRLRFARASGAVSAAVRPEATGSTLQVIEQFPR